MLELPNDHETQHIHDLLKLLKNKQPYREETNKNVLYDIEFGWFNGLYGITDFDLVLACEDSVFWLVDHHDGAIYFWSRIDDSMIRGGDNLKEALTNYLFCQKNLYYVDETTCKLVPLNAYDKEVEEWVKLHGAYDRVPINHKSEIGEKKKKKNKKKH